MISYGLLKRGRESFVGDSREDNVPAKWPDQMTPDPINNSNCLFYMRPDYG
jgi:hypothetical protein